MRKCERCGDEYRPPTANTRYCPPCRVARDIGSMRVDYARECDICGGKFYPIRASYKFCADCTVIRGNADQECALCGEKNKLAPGLAQTCIFCVTSSAKHRASYHKTLLKLIAEKIKEKSKLA